MSSVLRYVYLKSSTEWDPLKFNATLPGQGEFTAGEIDRLSGSHGLAGGEQDGQARETVLPVRGLVELLANNYRFFLSSRTRNLSHESSKVSLQDSRCESRERSDMTGRSPIRNSQIQ